MLYITRCPVCPSELGVEGLGDRIEHNEDGSHTLVLDPDRKSPDSGSDQ